MKNIHNVHKSWELLCAKADGQYTWAARSEDLIPFRFTLYQVYRNRQKGDQMSKTLDCIAAVKTKAVFTSTPGR